MVEITETSSIPTEQYNQFMPKEKFNFPKATMQKVKSVITSLNSGIVTDNFQNSASTPYSFVINPNSQCVFDLSQAYFNIAGELKCPADMAALFTKHIKLGNLFILSLFQQATLSLGGAVIAQNQNPGIDANMQAALKFDKFDLLNKTVSDREFVLNQLKPTHQIMQGTPNIPGDTFYPNQDYTAANSYCFLSTIDSTGVNHLLPQFAGMTFIYKNDNTPVEILTNTGVANRIMSTHFVIDFDDSGYGVLVCYNATISGTVRPTMGNTEINDDGNPIVNPALFKIESFDDGFVNPYSSVIPIFVASSDGVIPFRCKLYLSDLFNYTIDTLDYIFNREINITLQRSATSNLIANIMSYGTTYNKTLQVTKMKKFELVAYSYLLTDTAKNQLLSYYQKDVETIYGVQSANLTPLYDFTPGAEQQIVLPLTVNYDTKAILLALPKCPNALQPLSTPCDINVVKTITNEYGNTSIQQSWYGSNSNSYNFGGLRYIRVSNTSNSNIYTYDFQGTSLDYNNPNSMDKSYDVSNGALSATILDYREAYAQYKQLRLLFGKDPENGLDYATYLKDYCIIPIDLVGTNIPPNTRILVTLQFAQWAAPYNPLHYGNIGASQGNQGNSKMTTNLLAIFLGSDVLVYNKDGTCLVKHILTASTTEKNVNLK